MRKMYATNRSHLHILEKWLVPLHLHKVLQHPVADEIEMLLIEPSIIGVDLKAPIEISHFILVIATTRVERLVL